MKLFYFFVVGIFLGSCAPMQNYGSLMEDDIYYTPGKKSLYVQEMEAKTGLSYNEIVANEPINQNVEKLEENDKIATRSSNEVGYWMNGFDGTDLDLAEAYRVIDRYPQGFASRANAQDIAINLSIGTNWNVYTCNGRYWWFPTAMNYNLYSTFIFGRYPSINWTYTWSDPTFDYLAFESTWGSGYRSGWRIGFGYEWGNYGLFYGYNHWYDPWDRHYGFYGYRPYHQNHHNHPYSGWGHGGNWAGDNISHGPSKRPSDHPRITNERPNKPVGNSRRMSVTRPRTSNEQVVSRPTSNSTRQSSSSVSTRRPNSNSVSTRRPASSSTRSSSSSIRPSNRSSQSNSSYRSSGSSSNYRSSGSSSNYRSSGSSSNSRSSGSSSNYRSSGSSSNYRSSGSSSNYRSSGSSSSSRSSSSSSSSRSSSGGSRPSGGRR